MTRPVIYYQTDARWAANDYSAPGETTDIMESGCGPTAAAMVTATWADPKETPATAAAWALEHGYKAPHQGTYYAFFPPYFKRFGIECRQLNWQRIDQAGQLYGQPYHQQVLHALAEGALVISCMGPGNWTRSGHFVLLYGVSGNTAYVNDPASNNPQRTMGDWSRFQREVKYYFVCRRPDGPEKEDEDMTQEQFNQMMDKYLEERAKREGSAWSKNDRAWAVQNGIFQGDGTGNMQWQGFFDPGERCGSHSQVEGGEVMDEAVKLAEVDQRSKSNTHRIDKLEERQDNMDKLVASVASMATEQEYIKSDVTEIKTDVKALTEKPGKRWDAVITAIITGVAAFVLGLLLKGG